MQSRYYDPDIGRFLNSDAFASTGQGILGNNMFAYGNNNPAMFIDPDGYCSEVGALLTWIDCQSIFCSTSSNYRPHIAPKVDVTERLNAEMKEHAQQLQEYAASHTFLETGFYFAEKVNYKGDWDLKMRPDWCLSPHVTYVYDGADYRYDAIGNIHYGYVGRAYFSTTLLKMMGGFAQIKDGNSRWYYLGAWFDDPYDQKSIKIGCELWDKEAKND